MVYYLNKLLGYYVLKLYPLQLYVFHMQMDIDLIKGRQSKRPKNINEELICAKYFLLYLEAQTFLNCGNII